MMTLLSWACAFLLSCVLAWRFTCPDSRLYLLDHPNHRSLHRMPVPRSGGLALLAGVAFSLMLTWSSSPFPAELAGALVGLIMVAGVGFLDDLRSLDPRYRLVVQMVAAVLVVLSGLQMEAIVYPGGVLGLPALLAGGLTLLLIIWMVNLYNFMDGMDGLAGSMSVFGFGALALLGWLSGEVLYMQVNGLIAAASLGFLLWNLPPARLFLGDAGAYGLGFLCAVMLLWGDRAGIVPLWIGLLIFSPFIVDATVTLAVRLWRREKVWEAHREHAYQLAVMSGLGHAGTLVLALFVILAAAVSGLLLMSMAPGGQWLVLGLWGLFYLMSFWYLRK